MSEALARLLLSGWQVEISLDAGADDLHSYDLRQRRFVFDSPSSPSVYLRLKATLPVAGPRRQYREGTWALPAEVLYMALPPARQSELFGSHVDAAAGSLVRAIQAETPELLAPKEGN